MKLAKPYSATERKTILFSFLITIILILICGNYLYLATIKHSFFKELALKQHQTIVSIAPERAYIFDRNNKPIAFSQNSYSAFITPRNLKDKTKITKFLQKNFPQAYARLPKYKNKHFMYIKRHLTNQELSLIQQNEDIHLLEEPKRCYPFDSLLPVIGTTDSDNIGISGLEYFYNSLLMGNNSTFLLQKDGHTNNYYKTELELDSKTKNTQNISLTIDAELQELIFAELKATTKKWSAKEGAVVVMEPESGEILSMTSYINKNSDPDMEINLEATKNRCLTQPYEPGSVIKTFLALAALEEGICNPDDIIDCENKEQTIIDGMTVNTTVAHGKITFSQVIQLSNNIGVVKIGLKLGKKLYDYYDKIGFGKNCTKEKLGEESSILYHPNKWSKRSIVSLSFGYELTSHLLQLVRAYCLIVNGGFLVTPKVLKSTPEQKSDIPLFKKESLDSINDMLLKTVNEGTARRAKIKGYTIKAKTGSAYLVENGNYSQNKSIYTCIAIVEKNNYKRVIGAFIKEPESKKRIYASTVVVPMIEQIIERLLIHDRQIN